MTVPPASGSANRPPRRCPVCRRPAEDRYRPFCSKRCADHDLGRWLNEDYRIPTDESPEADGGDRSSGDEMDSP